MSSPKTLSTTSQTKLPSQYAPLEESYLSEVSGFDPKTADLTALQNTGLAYASGLNMTGMNEADALNTRTIQGDYLNGNPYLDANLAKQNEAITKQYQTGVGSIDSNAARQGIFGGSVWRDQQDTAQENYMQGLSDNTNKVMMQNYEAERANQINAANNAGSLFGSQVANSQGLFGLGANEQQYNQAVLDEELRKLAVMEAGLNMGYRGAETKGTQPNPNYKSPFQMLAGAAAGTAGGFMTGGVGGAVAGGLGGLAK